MSKTMDFIRTLLGFSAFADPARDALIHARHAIHASIESAANVERASEHNVAATALLNDVLAGKVSGKFQYPTRH